MSFAQASLDYWNSCAQALSGARERELSSERIGVCSKMLSDLLPKGEKLNILDVGTGNGFFALILSRLGHNVIGIDFSPSMIQCAYETAAAFHCRIEYRIMDAAALDFPDESFDAVVSGGVIGCLENAPNAYAQWYRVLKKGGMLICLDWDAASAPFETPESENWKSCLEGLASRRFSYPQSEPDILRVCGFAHCRDNPECAQGLRCVTAHKSTSAHRTHIPQLLQFNRYIKTSKQIMLLFQNWCQENGVSHTDYAVLHMITHHANGARPSDIASALVVPRQTLTRILGKLESGGLVCRKTNEDDKRSAFIQITAAGSERFTLIHDALHIIEEKALLAFNLDELSQLNGLADRMQKAFEKAFLL